MDVQPLLPGTEALASEGVSIEPERVVIRVRSAQPWACCPDCQQPAHRVHSGYERTLADLPMLCTPVRLHMKLRRFFCDNGRCARRTFVERLPEVTVPYARQTARLRQTQQDLGLACGGEGGSRLATRLGMPISADTLLRRVRSLTTVEQEPVATHRIGKFEFEVVAGEPTPEIEARRHSEALTAWLLAEWQREQMRRMAERN